MKSLWMLSASFLFSAMAVIVKMGAEEFGSLELIFYRSLAGVIMLYGFIRAKGYTIATPHLFAVMRKQALNWGLILSILLGFAGVCLVLQPSFESGQELGALLALSSGFLGSIAYWQIKELGQLKEPSWRIVFYFTLFGTFYGLIGNLLFEGGLSPITSSNVIYLIGMAVCATLAQVSLTMAFGQGNVLLSSCLQFSAIVFAELMGLYFFGDALSLTTELGIGVIMVAGVIATVLAKKQQ